MKFAACMIAVLCLLSGALLADVTDTSSRAEALMRQGNYTDALPLLLQLAPELDHAASASRDAKIRAASHALALGQVYRQLKSPDEAKAWLLKAETILRQETAPELLGSVLSELAELSPHKAQIFLEEAWEVWRTRPAKPELAANVRLRHAEIQLTQAAYAESKALLMEASAWLNQHAAINRVECIPARARLAQGLGKWHLAMGDFSAALEHFDAALDLQPQNASVLSDQALAYWRSGRTAEAEQSFQAACAKVQPRVRQVIEANYAAAILSWIAPAAAPETILHEASSAAMILKDSATTMSAKVTQAEAWRQVALAQAQLDMSAREAQESSSQGLAELMSLPEFKALAVAHPLRRHATVTQWMLEMIRHPSAALPHAKTVIESSMAQLHALSAASTEQARLAFLDPIDLASPVMALPQEERAIFTNALLSTFGLATRQQIKVRSMDAWKAELAADSALVAYFIYQKPVGSEWMATVGVVIVQPEADPTILDLGISADNLIRSATQLRDDSQAPAVKVDQALSKLGKQLWHPVVTTLGQNVKELFVFLEGSLASLPIPCLKVNGLSVLDGPIRCCFIANPEIVFHGAARNLPIRPGIKLAVDASNVPFQLAVPAEGWDYPYSILAKQTFPKLTNVELELNGIRQENDASWKRIAPTEAELIAALKQPDVRVWHFAGHGLTESNPAPGTAMAFGNCLLCPGVNLTNPSANDGLLFAVELAELNLQSLDLAVLSACDTGRGGARRGEAVFDLARACHATGVRDVFVCAAPVQDAVAPALMKEFYQLLASGSDAAQAAWEAQRKLYREHPSLHSTGYFRLVRGATSRL